MKKLFVISGIFLSLMLTGCMSTRSTVRINKVEVGMTKNEIKKLLGTPVIKNGDATGEQWGYRKMVGEVAGPEEVIFLVTFNEEGTVVGYETVKEHFHPH